MARKGTTAQYTGLARIGDEPIRAALKILMDRVTSLENSSAAAQLNGNGKQVTNVADPRVDSDAVNLGTLRRLLSDAPPETP